MTERFADFIKYVEEQHGKEFFNQPGAMEALLCFLWDGPPKEEGSDGAAQAKP